MTLQSTTEGLYCSSGCFHIDPVEPVPCAVVTHAHADHARAGSGRFVCSADTAALLRHRLGADIAIDVLPYGERRRFGNAVVSLHPAGHVLGSAQVRIEDGEGVAVVSGDYKRDIDPTCAAFEVVPCDTFVTEATFALPIYRWPDPAAVVDEIRAWIEQNRADGRPSIILAYALGKAQRILAHLASHLDEAVLAHGAVVGVCDAYRAAGVSLPPVEPVGDAMRGRATAGRVVLAPPSALGTPWMKRFPRAATAFVSGWMRVRGRRRWKGVDRGFVLSDHADWPALLHTVAATGATRVLTMHGYADVLARHLCEQGIDAAVLDEGAASSAKDNVG